VGAEDHFVFSEDDVGVGVDLHEVVVDEFVH